ncbi:MAG: hypothetical protein KAI79_03180 [Bacteroidales bacterium]|nr:hypothetical protein [Bacteroidales bacterium]
MLALSNELLTDFEDIFIRNDAKVIDEKLQNLVKYVQLPVLISTHQSDKYKNPAIAKQGANLFTIIDKGDDIDLVRASKLKLMLTTDNLGTDFYSVNIMNDKLSPNFTATYRAGESRSKAKLHIKSLLEDATEITIIDKYLSSNNAWQSTNLPLLRDLLPEENIDINIFCDNNWNDSKKQDLINIYAGWNIIKQSWNDSIHDRYIKTDKVTIILSSGLLHLGDNSVKDFTYIVIVNG